MQVHLWEEYKSRTQYLFYQDNHQGFQALCPRYQYRFFWNKMQRVPLLVLQTSQDREQWRLFDMKLIHSLKSNFGSISRFLQLWCKAFSLILMSVVLRCIQTKMFEDYTQQLPSTSYLNFKPHFWDFQFPLIEEDGRLLPSQLLSFVFQVSSSLLFQQWTCLGFLIKVSKLFRLHQSVPSHALWFSKTRL